MEVALLYDCYACTRSSLWFLGGGSSMNSFRTTWEKQFFMIVTLEPVPVYGFSAAARAWIPSEWHAALSIQNLDLFLLYSETI